MPNIVTGMQLYQSLSSALAFRFCRRTRTNFNRPSGQPRTPILLLKFPNLKCLCPRMVRFCCPGGEAQKLQNRVVLGIAWQPRRKSSKSKLALLFQTQRRGGKGLFARSSMRPALPVPTATFEAMRFHKGVWFTRSSYPAFLKKDHFAKTKAATVLSGKPYLQCPYPAVVLLRPSEIAHSPQN